MNDETAVTPTTPPSLSPHDPFEMMDAMDDANILAELKGRMVKTWVYAFPQDGQTVYGLSKIGVDAACREMARHGEVIREMDVSHTQDTTDSRYMLFKALAHRIAVNKHGREILLETAFGTKRQCIYLIGKGNKPTDHINTFWYEQGSIKALRNARSRLLTEEIRAKIIDYAKRGESGATIAPVTPPPAPPTPPQNTGAPTAPPRLITQPQRARLARMLVSHALTPTDVAGKFGYAPLETIPMAEYDTVCLWIESAGRR